MNLIQLIIRQPVTVTVGVILVALSGLLALQRIPIQLTPNVESTIVSVTTRWEGASPQEVEQNIIDKQEERLLGLSRLRMMTSNSGQGEGRIRLEFETGSEPGTITVRAPKRGLQEPADILDAGNSGTSMRLLSGVLASQPFLSVLTGDSSLRSRPMGRVVQPLKQMGAQIMGRNGDSLAPFSIRGAAGKTRCTRSTAFQTRCPSKAFYALSLSGGSSSVRSSGGPSSSRSSPLKFRMAAPRPRPMTGILFAPKKNNTSMRIRISSPAPKVILEAPWRWFEVAYWSCPRRSCRSSNREKTSQQGIPW